MLTTFIEKPIIELDPQSIQVQQARAESLVIPTRMTTEITDVVVPTNAEIAESIIGNPDAPIGEPTVSLNVGVGIIETPPSIVEPSDFIVVEVMPAYEGGLPGWKAGKQHNKNVSVRMTLPINFQLNNNN